jgi:hypothetical protein
VEPAGSGYKTVQRFANIEMALPLLRLVDPLQNSPYASIASLATSASVVRGEPIAVSEVSAEVEMAGDSILVSGARMQFGRSALRATASYVPATAALAARINADSLFGSDARRFSEFIPGELRGAFALQANVADGTSSFRVSDLVLLLREARASGDIDVVVGSTGVSGASVDANINLANVTTGLLRELVPASAASAVA